MASRRAKLKVSVSLPPRRKNAETADTSKQLKDLPDKIAKSPQTSNVGTECKEQNITLQAKTNTNSATVSDKTTHDQKLRRSLELSQCELSNVKESNLKCDTASLTEQSTNSTENVFTTPLTKRQKSSSPLQRFLSPKVNNNSNVHRNVPSPLKIIENNEQQIAKHIPSPKVTTSEVLKPPTPQKNIPTPVSQKIKENIEFQIAESFINNMTHNSAPKISHRENAENSSEETMDGIVPLQQAKSLHKPIDLLKIQIISENAEVLFDPIVPLPSPTKVRHKLRPAPRLTPQRRNSIQGSASESEDEIRRNLASSSSRQRHDSSTSYTTHQSMPNREVRDRSRVRNDSVCSNVSQMTTQPSPYPTDSLLKEKLNKTKRQEASRRMAAMRRRRENGKHDKLTMFDLIFYNPTSNPIPPNQEEIEIQEANAREELQSRQMEEVVDEPETPVASSAVPAPQIKLGPHGEIIIDEESLVVKQTNTDRKITSVVHEGAWTSGGGSKYKRGIRAAEWTAGETVRFYRALAAVGTDFTLMSALFPDRVRRELKSKFKKEEKINGAQVDKALRTTAIWDVKKLKDEFKEERLEAKKRADKEKERLKEEKKAEKERLKTAREMRVRQSRGAKALESTMLPGMSAHHSDAITAEDIIERATRRKTPRKRNYNTETEAETSTLSLATLTPVCRKTYNNPAEIDAPKLATPNLQIKTPDMRNGIAQVPSNIENGSLVVLTVNDPSSPAKKMLQTYIAHGSGKLTPVALPPVLLNSVVGYMKKKTPSRTHSPSSQMMSPSSVTSHDSRTSSTPSGISLLPESSKRQRHNSFTITQL